MSQCEAYDASPDSDGLRCSLAQGHPGVHRDRYGTTFCDDDAEY